MTVMKSLIKTQNWIHGEWLDGEGEHVMLKNPADLSATVGEITFSATSQVDAADQAAHDAFPKWKKFTRSQRGDYLFKMAEALQKHAEALARLATAEMGKPLGEMRGEVNRGIQLLRYYAGEGVRSTGDVIPSTIENVHQFTVKIPLGVVALITPWNFPVAIPIWKIAPALICGNTVIWKPAESSSLTAYQLCRIFSDAGLPKGIVNLVIGRGTDIGDHLVRQAKIDGLSFTGSSATGRKLAAVLAERNVKHQMEMGGKNAVVILNDADLDIVIPAVISGTFGSAGQKCTATSRMIVEEGIYDAFVAALKKGMEKVKLADPLSETCYLGPVASEAQFAKVSAYVELAKKEADIVYEKTDTPDKDGYYIHPLIVSGVSSDHPLFQEEIFGPIAVIMKAQNYQEAIELINHSNYGLSGTIFTKDLSKAYHFLEDAQIGMVRVNLETAGVEYQSPFGGLNESSSHSREQGQSALDFYTNIKTCAVKY